MVDQTEELAGGATVSRASSELRKHFGAPLAWAVLLSVLATGFALYGIAWYSGAWQAACAGLALGMVCTIVPISHAFLKRVQLNEVGPWFHNAKQFGDQQQRLVDHFTRIRGTLVFWKNKAAAHHRLDMARVIWSLISAVGLPVLIQFFDPLNPWSVGFLTGLTTWTGFIVALAYTMKSEQTYQGLRQQESDYYDISRNLLDFTKADAKDLEKTIVVYFRTVEPIRQTGRNVETSSPRSALE